VEIITVDKWSDNLLKSAEVNKFGFWFSTSAWKISRAQPGPACACLSSLTDDGAYCMHGLQ